MAGVEGEESIDLTFLERCVRGIKRFNPTVSFNTPHEKNGQGQEVWMSLYMHEECLSAYDMYVFMTKFAPKVCRQQYNVTISNRHDLHVSEDIYSTTVTFSSESTGLTDEDYKKFVIRQWNRFLSDNDHNRDSASVDVLTKRCADKIREYEPKIEFDEGLGKHSISTIRFDMSNRDVYPEDMYKFMKRFSNYVMRKVDFDITSRILLSDILCGHRLYRDMYVVDVTFYSEPYNREKMHNFHETLKLYWNEYLEESHSRD